MKRIITLDAGQHLLREKSLLLENLDKDTFKLINSMYKIMKKNKGVGLAAVQVGVLYRIFVVEVEEERPLVFVNPEIMETSLEEDIYEEGCLSIPGINYKIIRPYGVMVQAWNEKGKPFTLHAEGLLARVIQHEYDHLEGKLFIDHIEKGQREKLLNLYNNKKVTS